MKHSALRRAATFALTLSASTALAAEGDLLPTSTPQPTEIAPQPTPATQPAATTPTPKPRWRGLSLATDDGAYSVRLNGQLQTDVTVFPNDTQHTFNDEVRLRRGRLQLRGTTAKYFDFNLLFDFADARLQTLDAFIETTFLDELRLRIGKVKSPVSYDRLQSSTALHFLERTPTPGLASNRDLGLQLVGRIDEGVIDYQLGVFDGTPDGGSVDQNVGDTFDFAGRLTFQPFLHSGLPALKALRVGVSGSYGVEHGTAAAPQLGTYRTSGRATWFRYASGSDLATTAVADGERVRLGAHLYWQYGPVHVFAEAIQSSQEVTLADRTERLAHFGYGTQASWVLTGEDASWNGLTPTCPWGAVELAVRWGQLLIDDLAFDAGFANADRSARSLSSLTVGLNWYLDRSVKLQANLELTTFDGGDPSGDRPAETLLGFRGQLLF